MAVGVEVWLDRNLARVGLLDLRLATPDADAGRSPNRRVVDIESDDELLRRYMLEIPVVTVGGREVARAPIYESALEDALSLAAQSTK